MMKKTLIILLMAAMAATGTDARSFKRGVGENQFSIRNQMTILSPGVSWYYNWGNTPSKGYQNEVIEFDEYDFVPMVWNGNYNPDNIREYVKSHPSCKYLLGFNEPNFTAQSNMTPAAAAALWPQVQALAKELNLQLVAPAMNYSPNAPYQQPSKWMDEFVAIVGKDAFDFVAIHNYGGLGVMKTLATEFHDRYGKPVWVTEFCYWPNEGQANSRVEPEVQIASMVETVEWLEKTEWIYRYAWFKPIGRHINTETLSSPCYALIVQENGLGEKHLSPQGYVYTYMSDFNPEVWHGVGTVVPATEYIAQNQVALAPGNDPQAPLPIEISRFSAGAWLEYQFDVAEAGEYNLEMRVTGQGEPVRFDPSISISIVNGEELTELCPATTFTLPGNDTSYESRQFPITLPAGKITLRITDTRPFQPSGLRISDITLKSRAGVENVTVDAGYDDDPDAPVYTIDGRMASKPLAPGIYIRNHKKFIIR